MDHNWQGILSYLRVDLRGIVERGRELVRRADAVLTVLRHRYKRVSNGDRDRADNPISKDHQRL